ncbi:WH2 domain-containing protein [Strongyloides ratti]|uniref:WH2 domain-containing protein n=1 Tax=Strongyloides ratti TaxID=34506 RepID=A0A090L8L2_STRRB|nr:WH2 domain-containing protein [Strongyloides ratti]CEF66111.1 WH2 domain-containing protein [Strongyloides ratti]
MPPPPPPPLAAPSNKTVPKVDRGALLSDIHKGIKLKKAVTNDRSNPLIAGKVGNNSTTNTTTNTNNGGNNVNKSNESNLSSSNIQRPIVPSGKGSNPTEQLNSMFAGGFPKKPSEMKNMLNKPVSSPPVNQALLPEVKKSNLPAPPLLKPKPGGFSNTGTLQKKNGSNASLIKEDGSSNALRARPGGPPPPPPPKKFSGQLFGTSSGTVTTSQGIPPPPVPPPTFNRPLPTTLPNSIPPQLPSKSTNDSGAVSPVRPPPPPPQRFQSMPQVSTSQLSSTSVESSNEHIELNNNSKIEKLIEVFYSRFTFTPLYELPPPPEFKNIPKEYTTYKKKIVPSKN